MNFNDKYLKKFSIFKLELESYTQQDQKTFPENWIINQLQPALLQFLGIWHGAEVKRLSFYLEEEPLKICGVVEFTKELRHKINLAKPEVFRITGQTLSFFPIDCDPLENRPVESWEELHVQNKIFRHFEETQNQNGLSSEVLDENVTISTANPLKDLVLNVDKRIGEKKQRNQTRFAAIHKTGRDLSLLFGGTCNVFIYKDSEHHKGEIDFYGVLFEDTFTVATTPYRILVFREGVFSTMSKCRKEHHWFAAGIDNNFALLSFWKKNFSLFRHPKRSFHFERQGKILSQKQLENAVKLAHDYLYPVPNDEQSHLQTQLQSQTLPQSDPQVQPQIQPEVPPEGQTQVQPLSQQLPQIDPQRQLQSELLPQDPQVQPQVQPQVVLLSQTLPQIDSKPQLQSELLTQDHQVQHQVPPQVQLLSQPLPKTDLQRQLQSELLPQDHQVKHQVPPQVVLLSQTLPKIDPQRQLQSELLPQPGPQVQPQQLLSQPLPQIDPQRQLQSEMLPQPDLHLQPSLI